MFCTKCGIQIAEDVAFCGRCGAKINAPQISSSPVTPSSEESIPYAAINQQQMPAAVGVPAPSVVPEGRHRKKLLVIPLLAIAVIAIVVAILAISTLFPMYSCLPTKSVSFSTTDGEWSSTTEYTRSADGVLQSLTTEYSSGDTDEYDYISLGDGVACAEGSTATYDKNADGDITKIVYTNDDGSSSTNLYTYFQPGIVSSITSENDTMTRVSTYNERGYIVEYLYEPKNSSGSTSKTHLVFEYQDYDDGHSLLRTVISDPGEEGSTTYTDRLVFDAQGYPSQIYRQKDDDKEILTRETDYVVIENPPAFLRATSRLVG